MLDLESITLLFDEKLNPLKDDIKELKDDQKQVVELLLVQTRQDERLKRVDEHLQECVDWRKITEEKITLQFAEIKHKQLLADEKKEHFMWDFIKILLYILAGGTVTSVISKLFLH